MGAGEVRENPGATTQREATNFFAAIGEESCLSPNCSRAKTTPALQELIRRTQPTSRSVSLMFNASAIAHSTFRLGLPTPRSIWD